MKIFFTSLLLVLSLSVSTVYSYEIDAPCFDEHGNVIDGSIIGLKRILARHQKDGKSQVLVTGKIVKISKEDRKGPSHQKYNIYIDKNLTFQIISNLKFGRVPIAVGKTVTVCGEYKKVGRGMVHWTHFDPGGWHPDGFTIIDGVLYGDKEEALIHL